MWKFVLAALSLLLVGVSGGVKAQVKKSPKTVLPDLVITKISKMSPDIAQVTVKNIGHGPSDKYCHLTLKITGTRNNSSFAIGNYAAVVMPLKAGQTQVVLVSTLLPDNVRLPDGTLFTLQATVNVGSFVHESNETNNTLTVQAAKF